MAHVLILRDAPSFIEKDGATYGTHEIIEQNINKRKYTFNKYRMGYNIPSASEFKLINYRIKKECIPEFLRDLGVTNLKPKKLPKGTLLALFLPMKLCKKMNLIPWYWNIGKAKIWLMILLRMIPWLKAYDAADGIPQPFNMGQTNTKNWNYNFFLGVIEDEDRGMGEEL